MHYWDYGWGMGFGWIFMVLFWALVIMGIVFLIKLVSGGSKSWKERRNRSRYTEKKVCKRRGWQGRIRGEEKRSALKKFEKRKMDIGIEMIEMSRMLEMSTTSEKEVKIMQGRIPRTAG